MNPSPRLTGPELLSLLAKLGFAVIRVKASHHFLRHSDGRNYSTSCVRSNTSLRSAEATRSHHQTQVE